MRRLIFMFCAVTLATSLLALDEPIVGAVTGNDLRVRTRPVRSSEVLCLLKKGTEVTVVKFKDQWLGIRPPAACRAWIPKEALDSNKVQPESVTVRSGPGQVFTAYAKLKRGDTVTVLRMKHDKWALIQTDAIDGIVWTHGDYVQLPEKYQREREAKVRQVKPLDATGKITDEQDHELVKIVKPLQGRLPRSLPIKAPKDYKIHALPGEPDSDRIDTLGVAKMITRSGVIVKLDPSRKRPWKYALAAQIKNVFYPLFYLGNEFKGLEKWEWHRVTLTGEQRWIQGWPRPLVEIRELQELPAGE